MNIEHIAIWTTNLEATREFHEKYFMAKAGQKYTNPVTKFESYFLHFTSGARLELMHQPGIQPRQEDLGKPTASYAHISFATGSVESVNELTERFRLDGYRVISDPRTTGDGYYESVVVDPDGNFIELTV